MFVATYSNADGTGFCIKIVGLRMLAMQTEMC